MLQDPHTDRTRHNRPLKCFFLIFNLVHSLDLDTAMIIGDICDFVVKEERTFAGGVWNIPFNFLNHPRQNGWIAPLICYKQVGIAKICQGILFQKVMNGGEGRKAVCIGAFEDHEFGELG